MCGRYALHGPFNRRDPDWIAQWLEQLVSATGGEARYNIAPSQAVPAFVSRDGAVGVQDMRWGLVPGWAKDPKIAWQTINARAETAPFKPAFRQAYGQRRCVVPADGFFEWVKAPDGRRPIWFHPPDGGLLLFAGLYEESSEGCAAGGPKRRFVVLTTAPNELVRPVHDRMPAILSADEAAAWLAAPSQALLHPAPEDLLQARPVSPRVNSVKNDDPDCLTPAAPMAPSAKQLALF
mgnify:CR=1 FL=1